MNVGFHDQLLLKDLGRNFGVDRIVLLNEVDIITHTDDCLDLALQIYRRELKVHFSVFTLRENKSTVVAHADFPSNSNDVQEILKRVAPSIADQVRRGANAPATETPLIPGMNKGRPHTGAAFTEGDRNRNKSASQYFYFLVVHTGIGDHAQLIDAERDRVNGNAGLGLSGLVAEDALSAEIKEGYLHHLTSLLRTMTVCAAGFREDHKACGEVRNRNTGQGDPARHGRSGFRTRAGTATR